MKNDLKLSAGTGTSMVVNECQVCGHNELEPVLFLGYLPPVNTMPVIGEQPHEQASYPAQMLNCPKCNLVQLGLTVDPEVLFPASYPYTSSTTKILRENFAELYQECSSIVKLTPEDLIVDIGSNDGNLLSNFTSHQVQGITPEEIGKIAIDRGIPTLISYFNQEVVSQVKSERGQAKIITATNVFAHIENVHEVVNCILELLSDEGIFISESHYLLPLIETLQYDTIYHEHLRYYSLHSLKYLLEMHQLEVFHAKRIPTHGGSIRVYAAKKGVFPIKKSVATLLEEEKKKILDPQQLQNFKKEVVVSKLKLQSLLLDIKSKSQRVFGIGAPSRASTLINYVGLDDGLIDYVLEIQGSYKIGHYVPGTLIPIVDESILFEEQPKYALLFSWHIAEELAPKLKQLGFKGDFIIPLPEPRILNNSSIQ
jgi:hypothetical protein